MDSRITKQSIFLLMLCISNFPLFCQQTYDNFEGEKHVVYNLKKAGKLDSVAVNPFPNSVNSSATCAKYERSRIRYDNIKMNLAGKLSGVNAYATYMGTPPKIKLKVYTTAPIGTLVEIHLGKNTGNAYPEGTHSQYQAITTVSGKWEELEFKFSQTPQGSQTPATEVNQVTLLFNPYYNSTEVFYFDELVGPPLLNTGVVSSNER
ncbi:MAG: hypothetical protein JWO32_225 [Bacteroidetes bacterium]|nr:hypothetical protein [Bacteroidota bacterium]